jgi:hypothetical protein
VLHEETGLPRNHFGEGIVFIQYRHALGPVLKHQMSDFFRIIYGSCDPDIRPDNVADWCIHGLVGDDGPLDIANADQTCKLFTRKDQEKLPVDLIHAL